MKISRFAAGASLGALCLMLAACGGGGVNSTPTPTPGTGGGGGGGGGTPTPTPGTGGGGTPAPMPTSLVNPSVSASYPVKGANINGTINAEGNANAGIATQPTTLAISFNPATGAYKFTRPDGARDFLASELAGVAAQGWPSGRMKYGEFIHAISGGSENLVVSLMPEKALHRLNWVGDGLFIRQTTNGSGYTFSGDSFYFGLPTPAAGVPKTGSAEYAIYAQGMLSEQGLPAQILKPDMPGRLTVEFGSGSIYADGIVRSGYLLPGGGGGSRIEYSGTASITSNAFSGPFRLGGVTGSWSGEFFGPEGQEIGALFQGGTGNTDYVGTIVGSRDEEFRGIETDLLSPDNYFAPDGIRLESYQRVDKATGDTLGEGGNVWGGLIINIVNFSPESATWQLVNTFNFGAADIVKSQSNATYTVYGDVVADSNGTNGLTLLNPGPGNPLIQLSYLTYGAWEIGSAGAGSDYSIQRNHAVFGIPTSGDMPLSGNASYSGIVFGTGNSTGGADNRFYKLGGTVDLSVNFGAGSWSGQVAANGTDRNTGALRNFGTFGIAPGTITATSLDSTDLTFGSSGTVGNAFGYFFGPKGVEIGGAFSADFADPARGGYQLGLDGVFVSKQD